MLSYLPQLTVGVHGIQASLFQMTRAKEKLFWLFLFVLKVGLLETKR